MSFGLALEQNPRISVKLVVMVYKIILFYKYIHIDEPEELMQKQKEVCQRLNLKGRMIIASEGINATLEGTQENIKKYCDELLKNPLFSGTHIKISDGTGEAFPKLSIKVRDEIVASGLDDLNPTKVTGKYILAEELHSWIKNKKEFYIVDMRNDYEQRVGYFENSILSNMESFKDLPELLPKLKHLKNKTIVTVCTGGVRCEKASGFLVTNGFAKVYQLYGGIVTYMEKYPNEHFKGGLYVFDNRLVIAFNMEDLKREIVGRCAKCSQPSENYINCKDDFCHRHFICCIKCVDGDNKAFCPMGCRDFSKEHPEWVSKQNEIN